MPLTKATRTELQKAAEDVRARWDDPKRVANAKLAAIDLSALAPLDRIGVLAMLLLEAHDELA